MTHQRLIDILHPTAQTIDSLMQLDLPPTVDGETATGIVGAADYDKKLLRALRAFELTVVKYVNRGVVQPEIRADSRWYRSLRVVEELEEKMSCSTLCTHRLGTSLNELLVYLNRDFTFLKDIPNYPLRRQMLISHACCALHNYIRMEDTADRLFNLYGEDYHEVSTEGSNIVEEGIPLDMSNHDEMVEVRNKIANDLWEKYTSRRANRGARV
ncbi:hypothetical protein CTI12_AA611290 [Artemisia annua]|uniref:Small ribosomal subunit protein uS10 domain-containing protein n=1 Tax=Artemisia annua TaxID=35608 RepID=A0A2U1KEQ7_ARTAN|nr:hypothetical protein CTI12_AA611290 [Artemisia annua]